MKILKRMLIAMSLVVIWFIVLSAVWWLVLMHVIPCRWLGSGFEGGCGYGALRTYLIWVPLATVVAALMSMAFWHKKNKR